MTNGKSLMHFLNRLSASILMDDSSLLMTVGSTWALMRYTAVIGAACITHPMMIELLPSHCCRNRRATMQRPTVANKTGC